MVSLQNHQPGVSTGGSYMAHWAFRVNLIFVLILSDYRGPIYTGSNMTPWVLQGFKVGSTWQEKKEEDRSRDGSDVNRDMRAIGTIKD